MDGKIRALRTALQVIVAVGAAVPAAIALLPISASVALWATGIAGAIVILVSAVQNAAEEAGLFKPLFEKRENLDAGQAGYSGLVVVLLIIILLILIF